MTKPAQYDPDETPAVSLAGVLWPIPEFAPRQLRKARRAIIDLTAAIEKTETENTGDRVLALPTEQYELMCHVVWIGLTKAHPDMPEAEFLDMSGVTDGEIFDAFLTVRRQSGIYAKAVPADPDAPPAPPKTEEQLAGEDEAHREIRTGT